MRLACVLLPIASAFLGPTQRKQAPLRATTDDETAPPLLKIPIPGSATATLEVPALATQRDLARDIKNDLKDEIVRVVYFASLARNYSNVMSLFEPICKQYQIDLYGLQDEIEDFQ